MNLLCEQLTVAYGARTVLRDCALSCEGGEMAFLLGVNGAGKSTLLKALAGLLPPKAGAVRCGGAALCGMPLRERAKTVAYLPQTIPATDMTVLEYVLLGAAPHLAFGAVPGKGWEDRAFAVLRQVGAEMLAGRSMDQISGGEAQRSALAQVLLTDARFLLLDEPTASLDVRYQHEFLMCLRSLVRERQKGVLVSVHDPNLALRYADRIYVLTHGCVQTFIRSEAWGEPLLATLQKTYGAELCYGTRCAFDWNESERGEDCCTQRGIM